MHSAFSQGFVNLDFESANLSGYGAGSVPATNAIPGWTAYIRGTPLTNINYNVSEAQNFQVDLVGTNIGYSIQGSYSIFIAGSFNSPVSIGQNGTIPVTAQTLIFWGDVVALPNSSSVTFNGQPLFLSVIGNLPDHFNIYAADISAFAGQTGQLLFTSQYVPEADGDYIDNIQFSSSPIPEPGVLSLFALGGLGFLWHRFNVKAS
jgi:hypothetical protein